MRSISHSHHFHLPKLNFRSLQLELSPVYSENDELIQAIESEAERRDDLWQLESAPDAEGLQRFWSDVSLDD